MAKKSKKIDDFQQLIKKVNSLRKDLLNLRFQKTTGQLEKTSEIKKVRKKISQTLTIINEKKVINNV